MILPKPGKHDQSPIISRTNGFEENDGFKGCNWSVIPQLARNDAAGTSNSFLRHKLLRKGGSQQKMKASTVLCSRVILSRRSSGDRPGADPF